VPFDATAKWYEVTIVPDGFLPRTSNRNALGRFTGLTRNCSVLLVAAVPDAAARACVPSPSEMRSARPLPLVSWRVTQADCSSVYPRGRTGSGPRDG
jgi:hypothetical protein